jgi:hypothetical protein
MGYIEAEISPVCFRFVFSPLFIFNNLVRFVLALLFQPSRVLNNFSALFLALFRFVFLTRPFIINEFPGLFLKRYSFLFFALKSAPNNFIETTILAYRCQVSSASRGYPGQPQHMASAMRKERPAFIVISRMRHLLFKTRT